MVSQRKSDGRGDHTEGAAAPKSQVHPIALVVACEPAETNLIAGVLAILGYDAVVLDDAAGALAAGNLQPPQLLIVDSDAKNTVGDRAITTLRTILGKANVPTVVIGSDRKPPPTENTAEVWLTRPWNRDDLTEAVATAKWMQPKPGKGALPSGPIPLAVGAASSASAPIKAPDRRSTQQSHAVPPQWFPEPDEAKRPSAGGERPAAAAGSAPRATPDRASPQRKRFKSTLSFSASRVVTVATASHAHTTSDNVVGMLPAEGVRDLVTAKIAMAEGAEAETHAWGKTSGTINKRTANVKRERRGSATFLHKHTLIAERYQVLGVLGSGGMATVYRCFDEELEEDVALKLLKSEKNDAASQHRFRQEMRICRRLQHPNIVRTFEFGIWESRRFITMELLEGRDMAEMLLMRRGPVPIGAGLDLVVQAVEGLRAAHLAGVIHRDVKPHNLFVVRGTDSLKVMDFGIAKTEDMALTITSSAMVLGTPAYLAPERLKDKVELSAQTDLYSLGVVMYQLFTGRLPFEAPDISSLLTSIVLEDPPPPCAVNPTLPRPVEALILRCLQKNPRDRYADCDMLLADLHAIDRKTVS